MEIKTKQRVRAGATIGAALWMSYGSAATPPDAGQVLRQQQPTTRQPPARLPSAEEEVARPAMKDTGTVKVRVRSIQFSGADGLATQGDLEAQVRDVVGRELGFAELNQVADRVTQYLKKRGWMLARAYLPEQDVTEGDIEIAILRGRLEGGADGRGITFESTKVRLNESFARGTLANALDSQADALHSRDLERGLLLLNDLPVLSARATLERGDQPDTTRVKVQLSEGPLMSGVVFADNSNNRYTGASRLSGQMALNDPLHTGDQATLTAAVAERLTLGRAGYALPLGHSGLRADVNYTALSYEIGEDLKDLDAEGSAQTAGAGLTYPLIRSRGFSLWAHAGYERKALKDEALGMVAHDKRLNDWNVSFQGDVLDAMFGGGLTNYEVGVTIGDLDLSRVATDSQADQLTARTEGGFTKFNYSVARLQKVTDRISLYAAWSGQQADKNVDSSEEFMLGGPAGIRAYPVGEGSGDQGWLASLELRYDVPKLFFGQLQLVSFLDVGHVTLNETPWGPASNADERNDYELTGVGLGVNFNMTGRGAIRAAWATKVGSNPGRSLQGFDADGANDGSHFWLQAQYGF